MEQIARQPQQGSQRQPKTRKVSKSRILRLCTAPYKRKGGIEETPEEVLRQLRVQFAQEAIESQPDEKRLINLRAAINDIKPGWAAMSTGEKDRKTLQVLRDLLHDELRKPVHDKEMIDRFLAAISSYKIQPGIVAPTVALDRTIDLAEELFAPFPSDAFPARLDRLKLIKLLSAPLTAKIPVPRVTYLWYDPLYPELFELDDSTTARQLFDRLVEALRKPWPDGQPSKHLYTGFWDSVGYSLPEFAGKMLYFHAIVNRDVDDASITLPDSKRDYLVNLTKRLVIGGADRTLRSLMQEAVDELLETHKGANATLYGDLGYLILIATAGQFFAVYAMELGNDACLTPIINEFEISSPLGRRKVVQLFINLTRWVRTVHALRLLPPPPPAAIAEPFRRLSPYPGMGEVEVTIHFNHVKKSFFAPSQRLDELRNVYITLTKLRIPDAIQCRSFKIAGGSRDLRDVAVRLSQRSDIRYCVELELEPVGCAFAITNSNELQSLVASLLSTLCLLHEAGYVHRDICLNNIVKYFERWLLIDWELAGRVNQKVWWEGKFLPESVRSRQQPYTVQTDLWQVGEIIMSLAFVASPAATDFAQQLLSGAFQSAAEAKDRWSVIA